MWWDLSNWIWIHPSWNLVIVLIYPWLDLWFWVWINPTGNLLIVRWYLWLFIWVHPWLNLGYWVGIYPGWDLSWLNIRLLLVIICWSLIVVSWSLVVIVTSWSGLLIIPLIFVVFISSFFTLIFVRKCHGEIDNKFYLDLHQRGYHRHHNRRIQRNRHQLFQDLDVLLCL